VEDLARLLLLLVAVVLLVQLTRGTTKQWLRAKFIGKTSAAGGAPPPASPGTVSARPAGVAAGVWRAR
jgi:hypothetical protein